MASALKFQELALAAALTINYNHLYVINNKYLSKGSQNLVHYLSCQAAGTAYLNFCSSCRLKGLGLWIYGLGLEGPGFGLGLEG